VLRGGIRVDISCSRTEPPPLNIHRKRNELLYEPSESKICLGGFSGQGPPQQDPGVFCLFWSSIYIVLPFWAACGFFAERIRAVLVIRQLRDIWVMQW
jgi:hypothetical protein